MFIVLRENNVLIIYEIVDTLINNKVLTKNIFDKCFFHDKKE